MNWVFWWSKFSQSSHFSLPKPLLTNWRKRTSCHVPRTPIASTRTQHLMQDRPSPAAPTTEELNSDLMMRSLLPWLVQSHLEHRSSWISVPPRLEIPTTGVIWTHSRELHSPLLAKVQRVPLWPKLEPPLLLLLPPISFTEMIKEFWILKTWWIQP